jgi:ribosomal protein S18 acetylase RimI-like enzyme
LELTIRTAQPGDEPAILAIAREVVTDGTTYAFGAETSDAELLGFWLSPVAHTSVAVAAGDVVGVSAIRPNQPGRAAHVANGAYAVARRAWGAGVGEALCRHSLEEARRLGYRAMQFNLVVSTNVRAVALWKRLGFVVVGTLPRAFQHPDQGEVDAYVMHRFL